MPSKRYGTRSLSQLVPRITKKALGRQGAAIAGLITKWPDIVGPTIAQASVPRKLSFPRGERGGGTLKIAIAGSLAIELQHLEPQVLERINGFFGYAAVKRLHLIQDMTVTRRRLEFVERDQLIGPAPSEAALGSRTKGAFDAELKDALGRLCRAIQAAEKAKK